MTKKVLITGSRGFIGSALCEALRADGCDLLEFNTCDGDIGEPGCLGGYRGQGVEHVFHLAARTFVPDSWKEPSLFMRTNVGGTANVLDFCRLEGASLTNISSYLFGDPERLPIDEDTELKPNNPYALSKHLAEQLCVFHGANFGLQGCTLRPFNIYGPGQDRKFLVPMILDQLQTQSEVRVFDLAPKRDYVYLDDLIEAMLKAMDYRGSFETFNIASGVSHSVQEVIDLAQEAMGTQLPVHSKGESRPNEIMDTRADVSRAAQGLGWQPSTEMRAGLARVALAMGTQPS